MAKRPENLSDDFADLISQSEAARLRGVTRAAIGYLVANKRLRFREVLGRKFVYKSEVKSFEGGKPGPKPAKRSKGSSKKGKKR